MSRVGGAGAGSTAGVAFLVSLGSVRYAAIEQSTLRVRASFAGQLGRLLGATLLSYTSTVSIA